MCTRLGPAQIMNAAPRDHIAAVIKEMLQHLLQVQKLRAPSAQRHHIDAEAGLQRRAAVQIIQHDFGAGVAAQFHHHPGAVLVGLVTDLLDSGNFLLAGQQGDLLHAAGLVHAVGQFRDHDGIASRPFLDFRPGPELNRSAAGAVGLDHAGFTHNLRGGGEVRSGQVLHQRVNADIGLVAQGQRRVNDLAQVMRRNVGGHAHGDARGAVHQQIGKPGRQHGGFLLRSVVVIDEVHRLAVDIGKHERSDRRHADFGVAHGRRRIAIHRPEVPLAVHQRVTQGKILRHANDSVIHGCIAVRVEAADDVTDDAGGLLVRPVMQIAQLAHGMEDAPVNRLEAIANIGKRAAHDDGHRIVQIGPAHLLFELYRYDFRGGAGHAENAP